MHKGQIVVGSIGGAMFASFLTTAQMYYSAPVVSRSDFVFRLMVACGASCLVCISIWGYLQVKSVRDSKDVPGQAIETAGGDNSGDQIVAKDSVIHKGDVHHHHPPPIVPPSPVPPIHTPYVPKPERKPVLEIGNKWIADNLAYDSDDAIWKTDSHGKRALVIPVSNPIPDGDVESIKANRISVNLRFNFETHFLMDIERAYWIGESSNEIEIETGKKKHVLIGFFKDSEWCSYENIHSYEQRTGQWGHRSWRDDPTEKTIPFPPTGILHFEVCILYTGRNAAVSVISRKKFTVKVIPSINAVYYCEEANP